ncbi:2OG-Fe(II) oxygenase [Acidihalobacter ferrooxydans]|uniref:Proline hydroxylase n=1 Tax=Acidihalobacter ferrooxydans TaxID=1765967 RepID=A0A1P8UG71_9GAMM|nr:2OG-Fe(II) oxygenase [Acidihalobacter ferrooxydans]APZ42829.1 proline hydroxylase [Acidihalobacter ferrooxydans]
MKDIKPNLNAVIGDCKLSFPFDHIVVDNFFSDSHALQLEKEFPAFESDFWFVYNNKIENKKALNDWNRFPSWTYQTFAYLCSDDFVSFLSDAFGVKLYADPGLHGGGWHIHGPGGNLNPHLDYHLHPKLRLVRKLNLIIYLSKDIEPSIHGGHLGLWEHDEQAGQPRRLVKEIEPSFNRAVLFDTTQNSWHGMSRMLSAEDGIYRKSLAVYYMTDPGEDCFQKRQRALFAPRSDQYSDQDVLEQIRKRVDLEASQEVYIVRKGTAHTDE